ncbi:tyrosine-type recombinase/integrase, partial [Candidatus Borrarchaeum sp.]|uniref:tyrosine-type recombinase/integrase n=1 Tax=Candidatus Borrarchaeum sp. TaxID=2846742 RepID=UPI0025795DAC
MNVEEFKEIQKWLTSVKKSSAKQYIYNMKRFCEYFDVTPPEIITIAENDKIEIKVMLNTFYNHLREEGKSANYAAFNESAVKSFLRFYDIIIQTKRRTPRKYERETLRKEHIRQLVDSTKHIREKAIFTLGFQTGISISDIVNLDYGDVRQALEGDEDAYIVKYVRKKTDTEAEFVLGRDTIQYLRKYIQWRQQQVEEITDTSPLFVTVRKYKSEWRRVSVRSVQHNVRKTIIRAGLATAEELEKYGTFNPFSMHAVRKGFSSVAEAYGMPHSQIEESMG